MNIKEFFEEQEDIIFKKIAEFSVPELFISRKISEEDLDNCIYDAIHSKDIDELNNILPKIISLIQILAYYEYKIEEKDIKNMKVGDLIEQYKEFEEKQEKYGEEK